ncbi:MAG: hypothetical protein JO069_10170 [Verrucomicrobia bacterium]|nr:hypothetical protein [Verrucomicrobiota bacterium]
MVWSTRSAWRRWASLRWNRWLDRALRRAELLRVGVHPPDYQFPQVWAQVLAIIRRAARERQVMSYERFLGIARQ